jgi:hypothetical protein
MRSWLSWTVLGRKPWSPPIWWKGRSDPLKPPLFILGAFVIFSSRNRELQPFRSRKRYRRCSTSRYGHVKPFTTIMFPKNSGFQMGETSLGSPSHAVSGMKGI